MLKKKLSDPGAPEGRVLHAECGDGALIDALADADIDVYGIDPGSAAADRAAEKGLDVRRDDVLGHLASVGDEQAFGSRALGLRGPHDPRRAPAPSHARRDQAGSRRDDRTARDISASLAGRSRARSWQTSHLGVRGTPPRGPT